MDEATKVVTFMKGLRDGPFKTYLFREYPSTLEAAITLVMQEEFSLRQAKFHVNAEDGTSGDENGRSGAYGPLERYGCWSPAAEQQ
ncbi:hypothetical protein PI124_g19980 [Phytophthora idaei]|nr:hypothetical protein PI126_g18778 [Phytophthora idaei]KAG3234982.1 hypothetical protein PI124_g19980 [Phytophthora idaei]